MSVCTTSIGSKPGQTTRNTSPTYQFRELPPTGDLLEQFSARGELVDEVELLPRFIPVVELDNVRVVEPGENLNLIQHSLGVTFECLLLDALRVAKKAVRWGAGWRVGTIASSL